MLRLYKLFVILIYFFSLGCSKDVTIIGSKKISSWHAPYTQVLNKTIEFANGTSQGVIKLQVFSKSNQPIQGLFMNATPQINTTNFVNCTQSNSQGIIYCKFTATVAGTTNIDFSDGTDDFTTDVVFVDLPTKLSFTRVSNTKVIKQTNSGYTSVTGLRKTSWLRDSSGGANINTEAPIYRLDPTAPY